MNSEFIPYGRQDITESDIRSVVETLKSDFLTQGPAISNFEQSLSHYLGVQHAIAVSNGTAGLHLACLALEIQRGDAVFIPAMTFAATANAVLYCGGTPIFVDIDPTTQFLSIESLLVAVDLAKKSGLNPRAVIPVYYAGRPSESMADLATIAQSNGLAIIEDACHALGAEYRLTEMEGFSYVGNSKIADLTVFSFHPVKHLTTGEGGAITTNRSDLAKKLRILRSHGITKEQNDFIQKDLALDPASHTHNVWYHEMQYLGFNYRITDIQAALGSSQLDRLTQSVQRRKDIAQLYDTAFVNLGSVKLPASHSSLVKNSYHLYALQIDFDELKTSRGQVMKELSSMGIGTQVHYLPVYRHPYYQKNSELWRRVDTPNSERFYQRELSIPMYSALSQEQCSKVIEAISVILC